MKRVVLAIAVAGLLVPAAQLVFGKGHVPGHKVQVCHRGRTITVGSPALGDHLGHGDYQLPACDFANTFMTGDICPANAAGLNPRNSAEGITPACPPGTF